ncbi:hypothetical protein EG68_11323 [Paragonimus skrjabini miyazakii]|uniref:Uncharacterized protein n=1 Tax=Paragonimus skrjabini miyazakii TaxID=59628 RepID=A0A8S9YEG4_9TREM|nr:hypothetical protein EG68_11323 [Paragonimus skrjabini miyazakii]
MQFFSTVVLRTWPHPRSRFGSPWQLCDITHFRILVIWNIVVVISNTCEHFPFQPCIFPTVKMRHSSFVFLFGKLIILTIFRCVNSHFAPTQPITICLSELNSVLSSPITGQCPVARFVVRAPPLINF